jgi:hypothetical protein
MLSPGSRVGVPAANPNWGLGLSPAARSYDQGNTNYQQRRVKPEHAKISYPFEIQ